MIRTAVLLVALFAGHAGGDRDTPPLPAKPKATPPHNAAVFQGTVAIVTNSQLVLATKNERRTFVVPASALIVVNKSEATLYDVVPGQFASIASSSSNGQLVANFIQASRQY